MLLRTRRAALSSTVATIGLAIAGSADAQTTSPTPANQAARTATLDTPATGSQGAVTATSGAQSPGGSSESAATSNPQTNSAAPAAAGAQKDQSTSDADILVVARKRAELLTKIPESVQALSAATISRAGIRSLDDLGRQIPNVLLNRRQDNEPNVTIRGVGSFGNVQGVGFYFDDVQNFTDQSASVEDVERIEVLKGPQGTLYGGSDVGGAIKYILKKPTNDFGGEAYASYGSFDTQEYYGALNIPLVDNQLAARVSAYHNHVGGFVPNTLIGGNADRFNEYGVRLALEWKPVDSVTVDFQYRHNEVKDGGNIYSRSVFPDQYVRTVAYNLPAYNDRVVDGGILQVQYAPGSVTVTLITSYSRRSNKFDWDVDYSPVASSEATSADRRHTPFFTQEVRIASDTHGAFDWLAGMYYSDLNNEIETIDANLYLGAPPAQRVILGYNNGLTDLTQYAVFGTANLKLGRLRIGGGGRVNRSEFQGRILNAPYVDKNVNETSFLPKASLAFDVNADTMLYANVAVGEEPGKVNVLAGTGGAYRSERATSGEAGIKGQLFGRTLTYDLAGFYIDYRRRQFETVYINADNVLTKETQNIGRSVNYGVEGSVTYRPVRALTLAASGGYLDATWKEATYNQVRVDGLEVPYAPRFSANGSADLRQPIGGGFEIGLRADYTHTGSFFWDVPNQAKQPSYDILNLRASLGQHDGRWELAARVENTLDAKYYTTYGFNAAPAVGNLPRSIGAPGMPRRISGSVSLKF